MTITITNKDGSNQISKFSENKIKHITKTNQWGHVIETILRGPNKENMEQTAVEWLANELNQIKSSSTDMNGTIKFLETEFKELFKQAKEMEEENMINFLKSVFQQDGFNYEQALKNFKTNNIMEAVEEPINHSSSVLYNLDNKITKEEPKQETLEEALKKLYPENIIKLGNNTSYDAALINRKDFTDGAKWQQERYSEEAEISLKNKQNQLLDDAIVIHSTRTGEIKDKEVFTNTGIEPTTDKSGDDKKAETTPKVRVIPSVGPEFRVVLNEGKGKPNTKSKEMEKQQQGYSEEDMREAFEVGFIIGYKDEESTDSLTFEEWFEQFKNK